LEFFVAADRLDASIWLADEEACLTARNDQGQDALMFFEVCQILIGEEYFAARTANESAHRGQTVEILFRRIAAGRQNPDFILAPHAEQQAAGLIHYAIETRNPSQR